MKYSNGWFGFSVQEQIWIECGGKARVHNSDICYKFGDYIGWRKEGKWLEYHELTFTNKIPKGHFPSFEECFKSGWMRGGYDVGVDWVKCSWRSQKYAHDEPIFRFEVLDYIFSLLSHSYK